MFHHYSSKKIDKLYNNNLIIGLKPDGLWFAKPGSWENACDNMGMSFGTNKYLYEIVKIPDNILYIEDGEKFCKKYGTSYGIDWIDVYEDGYSGVFIPNLSTNSGGTGKYGDFEKYSKIPGGLLFYAIDCDSLCIWDTKDLEIKQINYNEEGLF